MSRRFIWLAALAACGLAVPAWGQCSDGHAKAAEGKAKSGCATKVSSEGGCAAKVAAAEGCCPKGTAGACEKLGCDKLACSDGLPAGAPRMKFRIGCETLSCPGNAEVLAKARGEPVRFVVGDREYTDRNEAMSAWAAALDRYCEELTTVRYAIGDQTVACPKSAEKLAQEAHGQVRFRVAAYEFEDRAKAEQAARCAREAAAKACVAPTAAESKACDKSAARKAACDKSAAQAGGVAGKACDKAGAGQACCQVTAKVELARARIDAAQKAIAEVMGS